jgi:hypothetical protein
MVNGQLDDNMHLAGIYNLPGLILSHNANQMFFSDFLIHVHFFDSDLEKK